MAGLRKQSNSTIGQLSFFPSPEPYTRPLNAVVSAGTVLSDPTLTPIQRALGLQLVAQAAEDSDSGLHFNTADLVRAGIGAGLGLGAAYLTGKVLGGIFGLPHGAQKVLAGAGAVGGMLRATGVWE